MKAAPYRLIFNRFHASQYDPHEDLISFAQVIPDNKEHCVPAPTFYEQTKEWPLRRNSRLNMTFQPN